MNYKELRKLALYLAENKANPKSKFAHLHPSVKERVVNTVYQPNMTDDELFSAIADEVSKYNMPKNPLYKKEAAISQQDYEDALEAKTEYDRLISPNKNLEKQADEILAKNPIPDDGDTEMIYEISDLDRMYTDDDELLQNLIYERINNQKALDYDNRYRTEFTKYEQNKYQPKLGPVFHIRNKDYQIRQGTTHRLPFNEIFENIDKPKISR